MPDASGAAEPPETSPAGPRRGVAPRILLGYVRVTVPFLFDSHRALALAQESAPHLAHLIALHDRLESPVTLGGEPGGQAESELSHPEYYKVCLAAHHATVTSFVPTDVDNQIRSRLWDPMVPIDEVRAMATCVEESLGWDCRFVSKRWIPSPLDAGVLSGHLGEWLTTAVAAYGALRKKDPERAAAIGERVDAQMTRQAQIFAELQRRGDGVALLKAAALIAHNTGDFDRVVDMWVLGDDDPLKRRWYKAGHEVRGARELKAAGDLNKALMAIHSHRHFPLRGPKSIRRSPDLLLPINPFLDDWGKALGSATMVSPQEVGEVVVALVQGFFKLKDPGYARALAGIEEAFPGGFADLAYYVPARAMRDLKSGELRALCSVPQRRFEEQTAHRALKLVKAAS